MSANDNNLPEPGVAPAGSGNGPLSTTTNESQTSSGLVETANNPASEQSPQQTTENAVAADTKAVEGGESAAPAASTTTTNDTTVVSSNDAAPTAAEKTKVPVAEPEPAGAHAKEVESHKEEPKEDEDSGPSLVITLLLTSGSRHPFKIDGKYLRKQSVTVENNDPFAMSVYTLKELIWREWRSDWESRPSSPSSIRLISFGKLLEDKAPLSDSKFNRDAPNVVHMTIKPQELIDEEDATGAKGQSIRERVPSVRSPGCRCVIL